MRRGSVSAPHDAAASAGRRVRDLASTPLAPFPLRAELALLEDAPDDRPADEEHQHDVDGLEAALGEVKQRVVVVLRANRCAFRHRYYTRRIQTRSRATVRAFKQPCALR